MTSFARPRRDHQPGLLGRRLVALRHDGRLTYAYNYASLEIFKVTAGTPMAPGLAQARMEFAYDGGGIGKGGNVSGLFWIRDL